MIQNLWVPQNRKITLCIDSYKDGVVQGRLCCADGAVECFESFIQFVIKMDMMLEERQTPQAYTSIRMFTPFLFPPEPKHIPDEHRKGLCATFELQILFRQHSTWQGILAWKEGKKEQNFRSVLELVFLIDSALRGMKEKEAV